MASLQIKIRPLDVPDTVFIEMPGDGELLELPIEELDEEVLAELIEEFSTNLLAHHAKGRT